MGKRMTCQSLGAWGERYAQTQLERLGFKVERSTVKNGDLRVLQPDTGEIARYEIKTARANVKGRYQATVRKSGHACLDGADYVLLIIRTSATFLYFYLIPCAEITGSQITITSHPLDYSGKWSTYRLNRFSDLLQRLQV